VAAKKSRRTKLLREAKAYIKDRPWIMAIGLGPAVMSRTG
jgi:ElaB/YqjD/DUF883 family membrane-anchored ribosome-binding protein